MKGYMRYEGMVVDKLCGDYERVISILPYWEDDRPRVFDDELGTDSEMERVDKLCRDYFWRKR